jgi:serine/threonine-protein kinase
MNNSKYPLLIYYFVVIISLVIPAFYFNRLPEEIASHFNASGRADGWMNKSSYFLTYYLVMLSLIILFTTINFFISRAPEKMINIPNKKYWLDPSRKEEAINSIKNFIYLMGALTITFISFVFREVYTANINRTYNLGNTMWIYLIILFAAVTYIVIKIYSRFNKTGNQ